MVRKYIRKEVVIVESKSNLTTNIKERDLINISKNDYNNIIKNNKLVFIFVEKSLYINNMIRKERFIFEKFDFLNLKISKGKTKKYLRVKLGKLKSCNVNVIKNELEKYEREIA